MSENTTGVDKTCLMHGPGYYPKEFKVLKGYSEKYAAQRSHKDSEACSGSKKNVIIRSSSTVDSRNPTSLNTMLLFPIKKGKKTDKKGKE